MIYRAVIKSSHGPSVFHGYGQICKAETPEVGGQGGACAPQVLVYQLTLFGPGWADPGFKRLSTPLKFTK